MGKKSKSKKAQRANRKPKELIALEQAKATNTKILIALVAIFVAAMALRVATCYGYTFVQDGIIFFRGNDAWYHMRLSENMLANFPHMMTYDTYTNFPMGTACITPPLFSWLSVGISYLSGLNPSVYTLAVVSCWLPPVLGSLIILPTYFIGKAIHGRWTGVLAAAMVALLPTQLLTRSQLGFADHHVLEIFLVSIMIMCLVWAYKSKKLWLYAVAGVPLGLYFLTWHGATFMLLTLGAWFVVQYIVDKLRGQLDNSLWQGLLATLSLGFIIWLPWRYFSANTTLAIMTFMLAMGVVVGLGLLAHFVKGRYFWHILGGIAGVAIISVLVAKPEYYMIVKDMLSHIFPTSAGVRTIAESKMTPPSYLIVVYGVNPILFGLAIWWTIRKKWDILLVQVWGILMLIAMISQQRWGYYLTVPMALLASMAFFELREHITKNLKLGLSLVLMVALVLASSAGSIGLSKAPSLMNPNWWNALVWMKYNTPPAFSSDDPYLELDSRKEADYGVMSWWDYGHWITEIAHRVPYSNPFQNQAVIAADFFINGVEPEGLRYVIIDNDMVTGKFYAMRLWLGLSVECTQEEHDNTLVALMWNEAYPGYTLVYANESVKIFEKEAQ